MSITAKGYAAQSATASLAPFSFERREPGDFDVQIDIKYCGVCHSDIHQARNEWHNSLYPVVPGHEIVGIVNKVGPKVTKFKAGDTVGVGCLVNSCRTCPSCKEGLEQYCDTGFELTYNSATPDNKFGHTFGGYSNSIVVTQDFVLNVSKKLALDAVAPLLCAGITTYSPLRHWGVGKGDKVGVIGLGGLGHMGIKLAAAMGAHVTMITRTKGKEADAKRLGAEAVLISSDDAAMAAQAGSFDFLLNTIPMGHDADPYNNLLKRDGTHVLVGCVEPLAKAPNIGPLIFRRRSMAGSLIGGIAETQEMLDFCAEHGIVSDIEVIKMAEINDAYDRMLKSDVKYRFVIDMATL